MAWMKIMQFAEDMVERYEKYMQTVTDYDKSDGYLFVKMPGLDTWSTNRGGRYKDFGEIAPRNTELSKDKTKLIRGFWEWLNSQPHAKKIGMLTDGYIYDKERRSDLGEGLTWKGMLWIYNENYNVIYYGSVGRLKNTNFILRKETDESAKPNDLNNLI